MLLKCWLFVQAIAMVAAGMHIRMMRPHFPSPVGKQEPATEALQVVQTMLEGLNISTTAYHRTVQDYLTTIQRQLATIDRSQYSPLATAATARNQPIDNPIEESHTEPIPIDQKPSKDECTPRESGVTHANALCTASANHWAEPVDWEFEVKPTPDAIDRTIINATGCEYTATHFERDSVDHIYMGGEIANKNPEGSRDYLLAVRARGPFYLLLNWGHIRRYYIRIQNDSAQLSSFGSDDWQTAVPARGANDGRWYTPLHIAVRPENTTVTIGCPGQQVVVPWQSPEQFSIEMWSENYSAKILHNCDPNFSSPDKREEAQTK